MNEPQLATCLDAKVIANLEAKYIECAWSESMVCNAINNALNKFFVIYDGRTLVAYGGIQLSLESEIYNVAVLESYRNKGYGSKIMKTLICEATKTSDKIFLEVAENNHGAIALYKKFDFIEVGLRKNYYSSGNALIMAKKLK